MTHSRLKLVSFVISYIRIRAFLLFIFASAVKILYHDAPNKKTVKR